MKQYEVESIAELYSVVGKDLFENGEEITVRNLKTKELIAPRILIKDPSQRLVYNHLRRFNLIHAIVESLMLVNSSNSVIPYSKFNKSILNFSDDDKTLYGSYGYRIAKPLNKIIDLLKNDSASRQCVLPILRIGDVVHNTKDTPCTIALQLLIRNGKLNMIATMSSNDIIWGTPYDIYMFTNLQEVIANTLNIPMGWYLHCPASLYVYETQYKTLEYMMEEEYNQSVSIHNLSTLKDWQRASKWYENYSMNKNSYLVPSSAASIFTDLIVAEVDYKEKNIGKLNTPRWAENFTKRWNK